MGRSGQDRQRQHHPAESLSELSRLHVSNGSALLLPVNTSPEKIAPVDPRNGTNGTNADARMGSKPHFTPLACGSYMGLVRGLKGIWAGLVESVSNRRKS
jgi:hypothetical protein